MDSTLVIKNSHTYCKKSISPRSKVLLRMLLGERLVGVNRRVLPTFTQRKTIIALQLHHITRRPYVHATRITNLNAIISSTPQFTTSMTLISPSSYLKTNARNQTSHVFDALYMKVFIISLLDVHILGLNS